MPDGISISAFTAPAVNGIRNRQAKMPRAAMWALRQAGRAVRREARLAAPVLRAKGVATQSQLVRRRKAGENVRAAYDKPVPGLLKASIAPSRHVKQTGLHTYQLKVGPRGQRVHLYAAKQEKKYGYMARGEAAGEAAIELASVQAFNRVWRSG